MTCRYYLWIVAVIIPWLQYISFIYRIHSREYVVFWACYRKPFCLAVSPRIAVALCQSFRQRYSTRYELDVARIRGHGKHSWNEVKVRTAIRDSIATTLTDCSHSLSSDTTQEDMSKVRLSELNVAKILTRFLYGTKRSISFSSLGNRSCQFWKVGTPTMNQWISKPGPPKFCRNLLVATWSARKQNLLLEKVLPDQLHQMQHL